MAGKGRVRDRGPFLALFRFLVTILSIAVLLLVVRDQGTFHQIANGKIFVTQIKFSYVPGLLFLAYSSGIMAIYSSLVLLLSVTSCRSARSVAIYDKLWAGGWTLLLADQALAYLMMASASAAAEFFYLGEHGSSKAAWDEKCSSFGRFCTILKVSIILAFMAVILQACISAISAKLVFKQYVKMRVAGHGDGNKAVMSRALPEAI